MPNHNPIHITIHVPFPHPIWSDPIAWQSALRRAARLTHDNRCGTYVCKRIGRAGVNRFEHRLGSGACSCVVIWWRVDGFLAIAFIMKLCWPICYFIPLAHSSASFRSVLWKCEVFVARHGRVPMIPNCGVSHPAGAVLISSTYCPQTRANQKFACNFWQFQLMELPIFAQRKLLLATYIFELPTYICS